MNRPAAICCTFIGVAVLSAILIPLDRYFGRYVPGALYEDHVPFDPYDDNELDRINRNLKFGILTNAKKARRGVPCVLDVVLSQEPKGSR